MANKKFFNKKVGIAAILLIGLFSAVLAGSISLASAQQKLYNHGEDHAGNGEAHNHGADHAVPQNHGGDHAGT